MGDNEIQEEHTLLNGIKVPKIGFGTFKVETKKIKVLVQTALDAGYTLIDTATAYENEKEVGDALRKDFYPRENLFLTTKIANEDQGYDETIKAFELSLKELKTSYLDLLLIHWPQEKSAETWRAMEYLYNQGKIRAIGVSNFHKQHLEKLIKTCTVKPMINQLERHPYLNQTELKDYCSSLGIIVQAWSPLAKGEIFKDTLLIEISKQYNKSISQIVLRWQIQTGWLSVVKASSYERMAENRAVFDFELTNEDIEKINNLNRDFRTGSNPDNFKF